MHRVRALVLGLSALLLPSSVQADVLLTPFAGVSFLDGGDADKLTYGVGLALGGLIGLEAEVSRTTLGDVSVAGTPIDLEANLTTGMVNLVVRFPAGPVQPYATGGVGVVRASGDVRVPFLGSVLSISGQDFGMNVGGGIYVFPSEHLGIRADVRYFRTLSDLTLDDLDEIADFDLPLPEFDFWRVTGGVTVRF